MTADLADIIAGELKTSRAHAYELMRRALAESTQAPAEGDDDEASLNARMAAALREIAKPLAKGSKSIVERAADMLDAQPQPKGTVTDKERALLTAASLAAMARYPEGHLWDALDSMVCKDAADLLHAAAQAPAPAPQGGVDCIGLALDLEARAKTVESQTTERAMSAAAHGLRLLASAQAPAVGDAAPTYSSTQATKCAGCGEHKHTPLRIDAMGGYVCLTCIDKKLGGLLGEFGYEDDPQRKDAERYRWLREHRDVTLLTAFFGNGCVNKYRDHIDEFIDAALESHVPVQHKEQP